MSLLLLFSSGPGVGAPPVVSAALSGTLATAATSAHVVAGGQTIILTLTNDTWVAAGAAFDAQRQNIINGLLSAQSEGGGWNALVRPSIPVSAVVRTSPNVATITLPAVPAYTITVPETITDTIPSSALSGAGGFVVATPTATITPAAVVIPPPPVDTSCVGRTMPTIGDMVRSALTEIRKARAGDDVNPEDMALGIYLLNRLLDQWNADRRAVYTEKFADYTLVPGLSPHTIGPGGTFCQSSRPISIEAAAVNLGGSPPVFIPVDVRDDRWYASQSIPGLTNTFPTDVYYETAWPLGKLYFWGVPTTAYGVRLWLRVLLSEVVQTDTFSLPPGYQAALELTLAEELAPSMGQKVDASTERRARLARALIFGNNDEDARISTRDAGMPGGDGGSGFNWLNRKSS